ncbi:MAG: LSU ribosomal protein L21 RplU [Rhodobacteraceae bacterium HLUCCA08]|nr:MAG: LSU ribosomal protein L21 RplU [Rhodobacteraceae bacterium HLUCCA08]
MFAVLKTGGKQYRVTSGDVLRVEKLAAEAGEKVQFNEILMVGATVGTPLVEGAGVQAEVIDQIKGPKTINFVRRRRKHSSKRTKGHRQQLTLVRITDILEKGAETSGVKAAIGGAGFVVAAGAAVVAAATPKSAETPKAEKKAAPKKEAKKAEPEAEAEVLNQVDDLKELSGVGPALEKKLHESGVTSFAQIAAWTDEDVAAMDEKLSFKGRIEREGWIEQAKAKIEG